MFKWLDPYAKPQVLFATLLWWQRWLMPLAVVVLLLGTVWGLGFTPADYQQGDSYRIIHVHVPAAIWSMGVYAWMAVAAFIALVWQVKTAQWAIGAMAPIGAVYTLIALFTGAAWGKPMWGTWWVWDARLTSELILLFLFLGVMALQNAFTDRQTGDKAASVLAVVGVVNLPIIHYSVEWWNTLHQGATITKFAKPSMDPSMLWPLLICILGFALLFGALTCLRLRTAILQHEAHRPWVRQYVQEQQHAAV